MLARASVTCTSATRRTPTPPAKIVGWVACVTDIAERKHAEDALRQREVELGEAQRLAHIGSWYWDAETDVVVASDELLRIFGLDPATDRVPTLSDQRGRWYPDADWNRMKAAVQRTMQTCVRFELDLQAFRNGTTIWVTARGEVVRNSKGEIVGLRGTTQDITNRKQAELTLAERNTQFELATKSARVGSYAVDFRTGLVNLSPGCATILGLPESAVEMSHDNARKLVHPEDLAELLDAQRDQAFLKKQREFVTQFRVIRANDGEVRCIELRGVILYGQDGQPLRFMAVIIDITERKRAEERQHALVAELDHRVKNALATVSSVVSHTRRGSKSVPDFAAALEGRLRSMAATHELLSARLWQGVSLTELVRRELSPYAAGNNTELSGPEVVLRAEAAQAMAMVLHELATNAAKHGALSTRKGRVSIRWDRRLNGHPAHLVLEWQEIGGPPTNEHPWRVGPKNFIGIVRV